MVFMSRGISQAEVQGFVDADATLVRFDMLSDCLLAALSDGLDVLSKRLKSKIILYVLDGISHNIITISSYPWSDVEDLVRTAIDGLLDG